MNVEVGLYGRMIQVEIFWVAMPCTVAVEYHITGQ